MPVKLLFLCTGNSCRSQMAEGLVNHYLGDTWEAFSEGTKPSGYVHPLAVQAMAELGIDLSAHRSKSTDEFRGAAFDRVITVCDHAAKTARRGWGEEWSSISASRTRQMPKAPRRSG